MVFICIFGMFNGFLMISTRKLTKPLKIPKIPMNTNQNLTKPLEILKIPIFKRLLAVWRSGDWSASQASQPTNQPTSRPQNFVFFGFPIGFINIFWFYIGFIGFSLGFTMIYMEKLPKPLEKPKKLK